MVKFSLEDLLKVAANILSTVKEKAKEGDLKTNVKGAFQTVEELAKSSHKYPSLQERIEYESTLKEILKKKIDFNDIEPL